MPPPPPDAEFQHERRHSLERHPSLDQGSAQEHNATELEAPGPPPPAPKFSLDECLMVTALAVVGIQIQLLMSTKSATSRAILCTGITFELVGLLLVVSFPADSSNALPAIFSLVCRVPAIAILLGILGLAVTVILETVDASLGAAIFMSCVLAVGGMLCVSALWFKVNR